MTSSQSVLTGLSLFYNFLCDFQIGNTISRNRGAVMNDDLPKKIGQYDIENILGSGGMSTVYKGIQPSLNRSVAIKVLPLHLAKEEELIERFERESSIIANLNHPNIIQIFDRGTDEGQYFIVMEHIEGCSLDELIHEKRIPIYQVVNIAVQIARGMEYAHGKGVVHRDIKPSNILISSDSGTVKVTDFGIAKLAEEQLSDRLITREQVAIGTADYMSPEQRRDSRHIDARSDIFSFGVLLYEMIAGRPPVGRFRELHYIRDDTPPLLNQIVLRCLHEDPEDRYPSFTEVIADLNKLTQKGLAYREALAKMSESVIHLRKKAKTAISSRIKSPTWRKRLQLLGITAASAAVVVFLVYVITGALLEGPSESPVKPSILKPFAPKYDFAAASALLEEKKYQDALTILRGIRTRAGEAKDLKEAAEAQWRIANIHEDLGSVHYAGIAYGYFADTYEKSTDVAGEERVADALFKAGMFKADDKDYERALSYLYRLRKQYPSYPKGEEAMLREVTILDDHIRPSRRERDEHRQRIASTCRAFTERYPKSKYREEVLWRLSQVYMKMGGKSNYSKAVYALEEMARDFPRSVYLPLYEAAEICRTKLKDKTQARRLYEEFLRIRPDSDRAQKARDRLKKL